MTTSEALWRNAFKGVRPIAMGGGRSCVRVTLNTGAMSYTKTPVGGATRFRTVPHKVPRPSIPVGVAAVLFGAACGMLVRAYSAGLALGVLVVVAGLPWLVRGFPASRRYRTGSEFHVAPEGVRLEGRLIPRSNIQRVVVRNHMLDDGVTDTVYAHSPAGGAKGRLTLAMVSYRVDLEAAGVAHTLAGGLSESTAFSIVSDVRERLGVSGAE